MKQPIQTRSTRRRKVQIAGWVDAPVRLQLERVAKMEGLSSSQLVALYTERGLRMSLHEQNEAVLYPAIRQAIHEEIVTLGNRMVFYLMTVALSTERGTIIISYVLKWVLRIAAHVLKLQEKPEEIRTRIMDFSRRQARQNIIAHKTYIKSLIEDYEAEPAEKGERGEDGNGKGD
jgi:hypothetical protein